MTDIHLSCSAMLLSPIDSHIHNTPHVNAQTLLHSLCHTPAHDFMQHVHFLTTPSSQQYTCAPVHLHTHALKHNHTCTQPIHSILTQPPTCSPQPTPSSISVHLLLSHTYFIYLDTYTHTLRYTHPHTYIHTLTYTWCTWQIFAKFL